jgi:hypothetical protein
MNDRQRILKEQSSSTQWPAAEKGGEWGYLRRAFNSMSARFCGILRVSEPLKVHTSQPSVSTTIIVQHSQRVYWQTNIRVSPSQASRNGRREIITTGDHHDSSLQDQAPPHPGSRSLIGCEQRQHSIYSQREARYVSPSLFVPPESARGSPMLPLHDPQTADGTEI